MPIRVFPPVALALLLAACSPAPRKIPAIGEAYVGPAALNLRKDLAVRAPVTATARHGERLEILAWRRRFAKVRSPAGVEGWTDGRQLLTTRQMARLRDLTARSRELPTHGRATVNDPLNVHTEPNRQAPSFFQIPENGSVEVIRHALAPRVAFEPPRPAPSQP
ncbi:MAG: SH3 domain-containing protein, partial [Bryobacteraceae bacterium]